MIIIPTTTTNDASRQEIVLEDNVYIIDLHWNTRGEFWVLDIYSAAEELLVAGIKLVLGSGLLQHHTSSKLPRGELLVVDTSSTLARIAKSDLGSSALLVYLTEAETLAIV